MLSSILGIYKKKLFMINAMACTLVLYDSISLENEFLTSIAIMISWIRVYIGKEHINYVFLKFWG